MTDQHDQDIPRCPCCGEEMTALRFGRVYCDRRDCGKDDPQVAAVEFGGIELPDSKY